MPSISHKGQQMPASPIRKLVPYAEAAKTRGIDVIHLNIGQPDIASPKAAMDAVRNHNIKVLAYSQTEGSLAYRSKLARYYQDHRIAVEAGEIIITTGGSEALSFALGTVADPGDELIVPEPFYANYNGFATAMGLVVKPVTSSMASNFSLPPIEAFEQKINEKTRAILICNPGNPTGYLYTEAELKKLSNLVKEHDLFVIADEVYREFAYDGRRHHSILEDKSLRDHAIMVDSVSKRYSMCGARIGCLISRNTRVIQTALKFAQARLSPPTFAQIASEAALDTPQEYFDAVIEEYQARRNLLIEGLEKIAGVTVARPQGAFYCIASLPVKNAEHFAQWLLESFEDNGATVMIAPAAGFYATPGLGENQIRIAYVLEKPRLERAIDLLKKALDAYSE